MLEAYLRNRLRDKDILLMTHLVLGYPNFDDAYAIVEAMVTAGVDLIELQIPFSEPIADGPVILRANQEALKGGTTVEQCVEFAARVTADFHIPFLFMSYYNILFKYGVDRFARRMARCKIRGAIVPDLPPEEGQHYLQAMEQNGLDPIFIYSPTTSQQRMHYLATFGGGFIYCVARRGVTGSSTAFSKALDDYLACCREATSLPLALGFGVQKKEDIDFLIGKADIAVIGTQLIRLVESDGVDAVGNFLRSVR